MALSDTAALYEGYAETKGWTGQDSAAQFSFFDHLAKLAGMKPGRLLEVGFGEGCLLDWAKARGYDASGNELLSSMVEAARRRGLDVRLGGLKAGDFAERSFDWIVAMDVFEHLTTDQIVEHLTLFRALLRPGGKVVVRFPNGVSPFFGVHQYGDFTHLDSALAGVSGPARCPRRYDNQPRTAASAVSLGARRPGQALAQLPRPRPDRGSRRHRLLWPPTDA